MGQTRLKEAFGLQGKTALITGGGTGLGYAIAECMAAAGAQVVIAGRREDVLKEACGKIGNGAAYVRYDVTDREEAPKLAEQILAQYGHLDILVNNAGITRDNLLMRISESDFDAVIDTNLKGTFNTIHHFYKTFLKQRSGRIINLSSVTGILGNAGQANYAASKAGVIGLTKSVARELAGRNITVNAVAPGFIDTEMTQAMTETAKEAVLSQIPMKRVGQTEDIAETVAFLASDRARYITGQVISVDGGMSM